jgi:hypothetical protein
MEGSLMALQTERSLCAIAAKGKPEKTAEEVADAISAIIKAEAGALRKAGYTVVPKSIRVAPDTTLHGWLNITMRAER